MEAERPPALHSYWHPGRFEWPEAAAANAAESAQKHRMALVIPARPSAGRRHQGSFCLCLCYLIVLLHLGALGPSLARSTGRAVLVLVL